jgi:hypothetical protein
MSTPQQAWQRLCARNADLSPMTYAQACAHPVWVRVIRAQFRKAP